MTRDHAQVVAVTGASAGIGRAVARAYGARGAAVGLLARGTRGLESTADEVRALGGAAMTWPADASNAAEVDEFADAVEERLGPVDVWVNAAFTAVFAPFEEIRPEEFRRVVEVDLLGFVHGTQAALRHVRPRDRGTVVHVGSALAYRGVPLQSAYCAAKHAIQGFHESLRCELLHERSGVRTTMVQLPGVNTPQFSWVRSRLPRHPQPIPPIYQPEVAARAVLRAAERPQRREHWIGGSTVGTLLANAVAPGLLDRYLARTGYAGQQTDRVNDPHRTENLWEPADGEGGRDHGAHGVFDAVAHRHSPQSWVSRHHGALTAAAAGAAAVAVVGAFGRR